MTIEKYFIPKVSYIKSSGHQIKSQIRSLIDQAVERQLVSDRPVGVYLSGGIDSSIILDSMAKRHKKIMTFSVGFDPGPGEDAKKYNYDLEMARKTATIYKTDHHEVLLSSEEVLKTFDDVIRHMDEPIANPTAWALFALSEKTKKDATVVLCGDGGDELFGGYDRYRLSYVASKYQLLPEFITRRLSGLSKPLYKLGLRPWMDRYAQFMFQKEGLVKRVLNTEVYDANVTRKHLSPYMSGSNFEEVLMNTDRKTWLVDFALMLGDTMSMSHGIEARVPFLDKEVVTFALSIPARKKLSFWHTKKLLRQAFKGRIPDYLLKEPKRGFFTPAAKWLRHESFLKMAKQVLSSDYSTQTKDLFNWDNVDQILEHHIDKSEYNLSIIWALLTFQIWAKQTLSLQAK